MAIDPLEQVLENEFLNIGRQKINNNFNAVESHLNNFLPEEENITTTTETITPESTSLWTESISYNRLYGVRVEITGLTSGQTANVRMFGNSALTNVQYLAEFTETQSVDDAQAWRYRDKDENKELRLQVENTSGADITVSLTIQAEPF